MLKPTRALRRTRYAAAASLALTPLLFAVPSFAQTTATVTVSAGAPLGTIPATAVGVNTAVWDGNLLDPAVPGLLSSAGLTTLRFPGGSTSDVYHWQTQTLNDGGYLNAANTFDAFMGVAKQTGAAPIITVNYGSNAAGNGGGDPAEAAAWVDYANTIKKYGVKYWEIGNEIYGNGEYGGAWETDKHSDHSPAAYGANVVLYADAMKAKDPAIKIGVVLASPGDWPDGQSPDWNSGVLAACGAKIDFVVVHWYAQGPGSESDAGLLGDTSYLPAKTVKLRALIAKYCGANAPNVPIFVTETNSVSYNPGKQTVSLVNGLFAADNVMTWLESGVANVDWWDLHNGSQTINNNSASLFGMAEYGDYGLLSNGSGSEPAANTPFAPYYGLQMLSHLGKSGDQMVSASSSSPTVAVHAVKQAGGKLALLLINKDPNNAVAASISVAGFAPAAVSTVYSYGQGSAAITSASGTAGVSFTQTLTPYSLSTVMLSPSGGPVAPVWAGTATARAVSRPGTSAGITATVRDSGGAYANAIVDVEVYSSAGVKVGQQYFSSQTFAAGASRSYTPKLTAPTAPGVYRVAVGIFSANWGGNLYWNANAAAFVSGTPAPVEAATYGFETGTQGWQGSGGMISGVSTALLPTFAGTKSLAVSFSGTAADGQQVFVNAPAVPAGKTITFHVWIPTDSGITAIQPYALQGSSGGWAWSGSYQPIAALKTGAWNTLTMTVPANAAVPLYQMGVQFFTSSAWTGTCYVDSVGW